MEQFRTLTGIQFDKVMIFPHSIAPEKTLEALKNYNYLATVNAENVPQDAVKPSALLFYLRPVTLSFAGFPSVSRRLVESPIPKGFVAINQFLDNPLLFFGHSNFFARGIVAFDDVADEVNKLEPNTLWRGLGEIVRHLYVEKLRDDSNYDVLAFSGDVCVENTSQVDSIFYVRKQETDSQAIGSLSVDGQPFPYKIQEGYLNVTLPVSMGKTRCVAIQYTNDLSVASTDISHNSLTVYLLRKSSDFRDIYLSKFPFGLAVSRYYYAHHFKPAQLLVIMLVLTMACIFVVDRLWMLLSRRR
jgi:hypothetical protein